MSDHVPAVWKETRSPRRKRSSLWQRRGCGSTDWAHRSKSTVCVHCMHSVSISRLVWHVVTPYFIWLQLFGHSVYSVYLSVELTWWTLFSPLFLKREHLPKVLTKCLALLQDCYKKRKWKQKKITSFVNVCTDFSTFCFLWIYTVISNIILFIIWLSDNSD